MAQVSGSDSLHLSPPREHREPQQVKQAETQQKSADSTVAARLPETYQWLLMPTQKKPQDAVEWQAIRVQGSDALAVRASAKLKKDELLVTTFAPTRLRMELDNVPLWRGDHVSVAQLVDDFARYTYLPRLLEPSVLLDAIAEGVKLLSWAKDSFAYADSYDESEQRYRGLRAPSTIARPDAHSTALLVRPEIAQRQMEAEVKEVPPIEKTKQAGCGNGKSEQEPEPRPILLTRFHGTVDLDPERVGRDAGRVAEEVISHLAALTGADVEVTIEISARVPQGAPESVVRIVTENSRTLKFKNQGFEKD